MAILKVNPTRMELKRLKERLKTASRGYKLLKDKTDEMVRRFIVIAKENKKLRVETERQLGLALKNFLLARATSTPQQIEEAIIMPSRTLAIDCSTKNFMNIAVPSIELQQGEVSQLFPYSFTSISSQLDASIVSLDILLPKLIKLAEVEKTCNRLADEIEKNKRRVNALENVMIPQLQETIKFIKMKLDENERSSTVRLMKVKSMLEEASLSGK